MPGEDSSRRRSGGGAAPPGGGPSGERARDLLERAGERALSDGQLVELVLGPFPTGRDRSADRVARDLQELFPSLDALNGASLHELRNIKGIGPARAAAVKAALVLGRRLVTGGREKKRRFSSSSDVAGYFRPALLSLRREIFVAALLNSRNELLREVTVSIGCLTSSIVHPREVFLPAVRESAASVIFVHNHPSGDPAPSEEDRKLTERLIEAGRILGIKVLDHVVVAKGGYVSLLEKRAAGTLH